MPLGPHLQHRRMIIRGDRPPDRGAQRRDGHGPGIVRVALARPAVRQQPDPRPELRLEIDDALASRQQLLGQQMPLPGRALHRPGPLRPARSPPRQLRRLATLVRTRSLPSWVSAASIATAVCDPLCGSIPMITAATNGPFPPHAGIRRPRRAPLISDRPGVRTAFEPRRGRTRQTGNSLTSQAAARGRQSRTEPARRVPGRYGKSPAVPARHTQSEPYGGVVSSARPNDGAAELAVVLMPTIANLAFRMALGAQPPVGAAVRCTWAALRIEIGLSVRDSNPSHVRGLAALSGLPI